ncbi:MAG: fibronectin type III domain-containing protein [Thermoplasmatota archaeon]
MSLSILAAARRALNVRTLAAVLAVICCVSVIPVASLTARAAGSTGITVWTEDFEGNPGARGVTAQQNAALASEGSLTAWNLINTSSLPAGLGGSLTWAGAYRGVQFYYVGLQPGSAVANGLAYTGGADTSLIITNKAVPNLGYQHANLTFALTGSSVTGSDILSVDVKRTQDPDSSYVTLAQFSGEAYWLTGYTIQSIDISSFIGTTIDIRFHFTSNTLSADFATADSYSGWNLDDLQENQIDGQTAPSAPQGLAAVSVTATAVTLGWAPPASTGGSAITSYNVYRGTTSSNESLLSSISGATTSFVDSTVVSGTTYDYSVAAQNALGEGPHTGDVVVTPGATMTTPAAPTSFGATGGNHEIALAWTAPVNTGGSPITGYDVYRGPAPGAEAFMATIGNTESFTDTTPIPGQPYFYKVAAVNALGVGATSTEASAVAVDGVLFTNYYAPTSADGTAGEPSIGVNWKTGNAMYMAGTSTWRVTFEEGATPATATWTDVSSPYSITNVDPILNTDPRTGLTLAGGDDGACDILSRTTNDGVNWTPAGNSCTPTSVDHPTVGQGPPNASALVHPLLGYPDVIYECQQGAAVAVSGNDLGIDQCAESYDGGTTFDNAAPLTCVNPNTGTFGHLRVGPDGTAYVPFPHCTTTTQGVGISKDNGVSWTGVNIPTIASPSGISDPSIAAGRGDKFPGGRLYFSAEDNHSQPVVTTSIDDGAHWSTPIDLAEGTTAVQGDAVGVHSVAFMETIAGDDDRAAVAFLGTKQAGDAFSPTFNGTWDLYVAFTYDGGQTWKSWDATPQVPVQRGWICTKGTTCTNGRNLDDFNDITIDSQGKVLVAYADGCIDACASPTGGPGDSTHALPAIALQTAGDCLFASACGPVSGTTLPPTQPVTQAPATPSLFTNADTCDPNLVIFSSNSMVASQSLNEHALICDVEPDTGGAPIATAFINPASDQVSIRYTKDLGAAVPTLIAKVRGLGANTTVNLTRATFLTSFDYNSPEIPITLMATGPITATLEYPNGTYIDSVTFHSVN